MDAPPRFGRALARTAAMRGPCPAAARAVVPLSPATIGRCLAQFMINGVMRGLRRVVPGLATLPFALRRR